MVEDGLEPLLAAVTWRHHDLVLDAPICRRAEVALDIASRVVTAVFEDELLRVGDGGAVDLGLGEDTDLKLVGHDRRTSEQRQRKRKCEDKSWVCEGTHLDIIYHTRPLGLIKDGEVAVRKNCIPNWCLPIHCRRCAPIVQVCESKRRE